MAFPPDDDTTFTLGAVPQTPADTAVLWGASIAGVTNKLPTYIAGGQIDQGMALDALETASGLVLARVGAVGQVPEVLANLAAKVVETGAAAMIEKSSFPEQSTDAKSLGSVLWSTYEQLLEALVAGVEAVGGDPNVAMQPVFSMPPPGMWGGYG